MEDSSHPGSCLQDRIDAFENSVYRGDIEAMRAQVAAGFDPNAVDQSGETILELIIRGLEDHPEIPKHRMVEELLRLGVDARRLSPEGFSPLFAAVLNMDTEMLRLLLDAGADPNAMKMDSKDETFYDWAEFDYRYEVWILSLPVEAGVGVRADEDLWLDHLDGLALKYGKRRPDHLRLLRERGTLTMEEVARRSGLFLKIAPSSFDQRV